MITLKKKSFFQNYSTIIWSVLLGFSLVHHSPLTHHAHADKPIYRMQKNTDCSVVGNIFSVTLFDSVSNMNRTYSQTISGNNKFIDLDCGWDTASIYDGKNFYVFDSSNHFFYQTNLVEQNNPYVEVSSGYQLAAIYDGSQFIVYDKNKKSFVYEYAKINSDVVYLSSGGNVAVLIDGGDIISYDSTRGIFQKSMINTPSNSNVKPVAIAGMNSIIGYDGTQIYAYCLSIGMWRMLSAQENIQLTPMTNQNGTVVSLVNRYQQYQLNEVVCSI